MYYYVRHVIDVIQVIILMLFDFSKAFDTVSHSWLLMKLRALEFFDCVLSWVFSRFSVTSWVEPKLMSGGRGLAAFSGVP